jgi:hypothetical protein
MIRRPLGPGWGAFRVCILDGFGTTGETCEKFLSNMSTVFWNRPVTVRTPAGAGTYTVEIRSLDAGLIGIESVDVVGALPALGAGLYEEFDPGLSLTGEWTPLIAATAKGGTLYYTTMQNSSAEMAFRVNTTSVDQLTIYRPIGTGWGSMQVCRRSGATPPYSYSDCQNINAVAGTIVYGTFINVDIGGSGLNLSPGDETVSIRTSSGYIGIEAIELVEFGPLSEGYYEQTDFNLTYRNAAGTPVVPDFNPSSVWVNLVNGGESGGSSTYTSIMDASVGFEIASGTTGFVVHVRRAPWSAPMQVCYKLVTTAGDPCNTFSQTIPTTFSVDQRTFGYAFYGLLESETYEVVIRHVGVTGVNYLVVDSITVLGDAPAPLTAVGGNPTRYDDTDANIEYAADALWTQGTFATVGYYQNSLSYSAYSGAISRFSFTGNSVTLYLLSNSSGSKNVRVCLILETEEGNGSQCSAFSQNNATTVVQAPVTLYGFGAGTHEIIMENRDYGRYFMLDAIEVR